MYPIIVLSITGLITLFLGIKNPQSKSLIPTTALFLILALAANFIDWNVPGTYFFNMLEVNNGLIIIQSVIIVATLLVTLLCTDQFTEDESHPAEYYSLMQFAAIGAILMTSFNNWIMLFLGLEILSIALYVLTGSDKSNLRGNEASLKYFLMGAFATGILLFGLAMLYGATGSLDINNARMVVGAPIGFKVLLYIGITFTLLGLLFKISAAPLHFWTPDVYQGAPTLFTAFMAVVVKTSLIFALYRVFANSFYFEYPFWSKLLVGVITLSLIIGNVTAVLQDNFKRMFAYSSISQAGFMLMALLGLIMRGGGLNEKIFGSLAFYSASYTLAAIASLGVLALISRQDLVDGRPNENINVFNGLFKRNPGLAVVTLISMLSLGGIPITSGFWAKFFVFNDALSRGYLWILILAVFMSAISLYYYLKPVVASFREGSDEAIEVKPIHKWVLYLVTLGTVLLGIMPSVFRDLF